MPDGNTDPDGQVCTACFNDYGRRSTLTNQWQRDRASRSGRCTRSPIGARRASRTSIRKRLFAIHFEAKTPGADYDFWVDDIAFICKG